jgi:hypothetical protein
MVYWQTHAHMAIRHTYSVHIQKLQSYSVTVFRIQYSCIIDKPQHSLYS